jgi:hypothetical protein
MREPYSAMVMLLSLFLFLFFMSRHAIFLSDKQYREANVKAINTIEFYRIELRLPSLNFSRDLGFQFSSLGLMST